MTEQLFHKCPDAEQHIGVIALSQFLNRIPFSMDYMICKRIMKIGEENTYWLKYNESIVGLIKTKIVCKDPLLISSIFSPLANLN